MSIPIQVIRLSVVALGIIAIVAFKIVSSNMAEKKIDKALANLPKGLVTYEDVSVDLLGFDVHINNIKIHAPGQKDAMIDEIVINSIDSDNEVPNYLDLEINGIEIDIESLKYDRKMSKLLDGLGYENLKADLALSYSYDKDDKIMEIKNMSFEVKDAGELSFKTNLHGINSLQNLSMQLMMNPRSIKVAKSSIKYEDESLAARLIKSDALAAGLSEDKFKENVLSELANTLKKAEEKEKKYEITMLEEVIDFFENPSSFEISISPEEPISVWDMQKANSANELMKKINLDISAN